MALLFAAMTFQVWACPDGNGRGRLCSIPRESRPVSGAYSKQTLKEWSEWLQLHQDGKKTVYAYFNNDAEAQAVKDALKLQQILQPKKTRS